MKLEVEVISKEIITPSSPTPAHLRHYQLSSLDQVAPPVYNPLVLFYEFNDKAVEPNITEISNHLKKSLAKVLTIFYPLAGRIKHNDWCVDCNDEGIPYLEAHVNCKLSDVLENPISDQLSKLMPFEVDDHIGNELVLGIQLSVFECGGFAIGQCVSHKLADASSYFMFSKTWAATARGESNIEHPDFLSGTRFPPKNTPAYDPRSGLSRNIVTKRFLFCASTLEVLRAKYEESLGFAENQKHPSRVDALSAFIWSRCTANTIKITAPHEEKLHIFAQAVNLRPRFDPPLPQHCFGNIYRAAVTGPLLSTGDACNAYGRAVMEVREVINKIESECVKGLQQGCEQSGLPMNENSGRLRELEVVGLGFSSYCRFPAYDNDFGWGRPAWVFSAPLTFKNVATFMDTKDGNGIEVYISVKEQLMSKFETDSEFLAYVSPSGH